MNKNKNGFALLLIIVGIPALLLFSNKMLHIMALMIETSLQRQMFYTDVYKANLVLKQVVPFIINNFYMLKQQINKKNGTSIYENNIFNFHKTNENLDNFFVILKINESTKKKNVILVEVAKQEKDNANIHKLLRCLFKMDEKNNQCVVSNYTLIDAL